MSEYLFEDRDPRSLARIAQGANTDERIVWEPDYPSG
jgi:hypothetical protein